MSRIKTKQKTKHLMGGVQNIMVPLLVSMVRRRGFEIVRPQDMERPSLIHLEGGDSEYCNYET
jgi:hypothetical protein